MCTDSTRCATGELGWTLCVDYDSAGDLYKAIIEAGRKHGIVDFGSYAERTLRVEKGIPTWGSEVGRPTTPSLSGH